jgi:hypothetical protein
MWEVEATGNGEGATITVNGQTNAVEVGANFKETVIGAAQKFGLGKFRLFLKESGQAEAEIKPSEAPALVAEGHAIRLVPFDVAG